jgi:hypothetical protein
MYGQVAIERLLSARFFFIAVIHSIMEAPDLSGAQPVRRTVPGDWGMPTNKRSPLFVQKDTACHDYKFTINIYYFAFIMQ